MTPLRRLALLAALLLGALPATAQDAEVPYWATLRSTEVNMRVGPSEEYRITWIYRRVGLPVKVLRTKEGWRWVEEQDGTRGWMLGRFLSPTRGAVVIGQGLAEMRESASPAARLLWRLEPGVVGRLGECEDGWCSLTVGRRSGYVAEDRLWGDGRP